MPVMMWLEGMEVMFSSASPAGGDSVTTYIYRESFIIISRGGQFWGGKSLEKCSFLEDQNKYIFLILLNFLTNENLIAG